MEDSRIVSRPADFSAITGQLFTRRRFLKASLATAAVASTAGLLAACETDDDDEPVDPGAADDVDDEVVDTDDEPVDDTEDEPVDDEPADDEPVDDDEGRRGGELLVGLTFEPPTLDNHKSTVATVSLIGWHIYEPLFTWDEEYVLTPDLVDTHEISDDLLTQTFTLRENIPFHNGDILDSEDVVASLERWISDVGMESVESVEAVDELSVAVQTVSPTASLAAELARSTQGAAIYPASLIEEYGAETIPPNAIVGTGPYVLADYQPDRHYRLERFDDYVSRDEEPSGYAGRKYQYVDAMVFMPTPDDTARIAALQTGDFHVIMDVPLDAADELDADERVTFEFLPPMMYSIFAMNKDGGLLTDVTLRQAIQAGLDHEEIGLAQFGQGNFRLDAGLFPEESGAWHTTVGEEYYNQADPERAQELLEEAGYEGETIRFMAAQEPAYMYDGGLMGTQQMEEMGLDIDLQIYDFATVSERRADPEVWEMFSSAHFFVADPSVHPAISTSYPGWWRLEEKEELRSQLAEETDQDSRFEIWEDLQRLFYEDVNLIKIVEPYDASARSPILRNFNPIALSYLCFWNVWLDE